MNLFSYNYFNIKLIRHFLSIEIDDGFSSPQTWNREKQWLLQRDVINLKNKVFYMGGGFE